jgi:catecholate siderophore receptor
MLRTYLSLGFLAIGIFACSAAGAEQVTGTVVDQTHAVLTGARVTLEQELAHTATIVLTDARGAFRFDHTGPGSYRLTVECEGFEPAAERIRVDTAPFEVPAIMLAAASVRTAVTVTEGLGYQVPVATSATKTPTLMLDIPQSIQPVARTVIEEQAALSLNDVLRNVSGVSPSLGEGRRDHMLIRGFNAASDQYIDGVRDDALYYRDLSRPSKSSRDPPPCCSAAAPQAAWSTASRRSRSANARSAA